MLGFDSLYNAVLNALNDASLSTSGGGGLTNPGSASAQITAGNSVDIKPASGKYWILYDLILDPGSGGTVTLNYHDSNNSRNVGSFSFNSDEVFSYTPILLPTYYIKVTANTENANIFYTYDEKDLSSWGTK